VCARLQTFTLSPKPYLHSFWFSASRLLSRWLKYHRNLLGTYVNDLFIISRCCCLGRGEHERSSEKRKLRLEYFIIMALVAVPFNCLLLVSPPGMDDKYLLQHFFFAGLSSEAPRRAGRLHNEKINLSLEIIPSFVACFAGAFPVTFLVMFAHKNVFYDRAKYMLRAFRFT
jgi:hypothetical protein